MDLSTLAGLYGHHGAVLLILYTCSSIELVLHKHSAERVYQIIRQCGQTLLFPCDKSRSIIM